MSSIDDRIDKMLQAKIFLPQGYPYTDFALELSTTYRRVSDDGMRLTRPSKHKDKMPKNGWEYWQDESKVIASRNADGDALIVSAPLGNTSDLPYVLPLVEILHGEYRYIPGSSKTLSLIPVVLGGFAGMAIASGLSTGYVISPESLFGVATAIGAVVLNKRMHDQGQQLPYPPPDSIDEMGFGKYRDNVPILAPAIMRKLHPPFVL